MPEIPGKTLITPHGRFILGRMKAASIARDGGMLFSAKVTNGVTHFTPLLVGKLSEGLLRALDEEDARYQRLLDDIQERLKK